MRRRISPLHARPGFTFLEVVVSATILSVGIIGVLGAVSLTVQRSGTAFNLATAADIAQNQIVQATKANSSSLGPRQGEEDKYQWEVNYESLDNNVVKARVVVTWQSRGDEESFELEELFIPAQAKE